MKYRGFMFRNAGVTLVLEDVQILVSADGYIRINAQNLRSMELILTFDQVVAAMAEERDLWK